MGRESGFGRDGGFARSSARGARGPSGYTLYEAHIAGQSGARRGLKGGTPVLDAARTAYLTTQWTGADDRRLPQGLIRRVSI
jgi:hypothetical protein